VTGYADQMATHTTAVVTPRSVPLSSGVTHRVCYAVHHPPSLTTGQPNDVTLWHAGSTLTTQSVVAGCASHVMTGGLRRRHKADGTNVTHRNAVSCVTC
jgi:hypothetical protein